MIPTSRTEFDISTSVIYDFLVIPKDNSSKEYVIQDKIVNRFRHLRTPVNIIVHDINYVNEGLAEGQYFFTDIIKEGILLFNSGTVHFQTARELTPNMQSIFRRNYLQYFRFLPRMMRRSIFLIY